ncbi:hypothetical protein FQA47_005214 [Oryzias melastigma]|uniref:Uncharacterized protein n=1 Tax=Oryzias melastigma TaxID=30732 RepID=A0A834CB77_ORYME|nr:hypothetical protein FQA47_005214 [Oryzias melastigma]
MGVTAPPQHVNTEAPWGGLQDSKWPEDLHHQEQLYVKHPPPPAELQRARSGASKQEQRAPEPPPRTCSPARIRRLHAGSRRSGLRWPPAGAAPDRCGTWRRLRGESSRSRSHASDGKHARGTATTRASARTRALFSTTTPPPHPPRLQLTKTTPN